MVIGTSFRIMDPVVDPTPTPVRLASRLATLDGKRVGLYTNAKTNATEILEMVSGMLQQRYKVKEFVRLRFPIGGQISEDHRHADVAVLAIGD